MTALAGDQGMTALAGDQGMTALAIVACVVSFGAGLVLGVLATLYHFMVKT